jgi:hypothetical protein
MSNRIISRIWISGRCRPDGVLLAWRNLFPPRLGREVRLKLANPTILYVVLLIVALLSKRTSLISGIIVVSVIMGVFGVYTYKVIRNSMRSHWSRASGFFIPLILILLLPTYGRSIDLWIDEALIEIMPNFARACIVGGNNIEKDAVFSVCADHVDNLLLVGWMIVYDSSDQIQMPPAARSIQWKQLVGRLPNTPFGVLDFVSAPLGNHFYQVEFFDSDSGNTNL